MLLVLVLSFQWATRNACNRQTDHTITVCPVALLLGITTTAEHNVLQHTAEHNVLQHTAEHNVLQHTAEHNVLHCWTQCTLTHTTELTCLWAVYHDRSAVMGIDRLLGACDTVFATFELGSLEVEKNPDVKNNTIWYIHLQSPSFWSNCTFVQTNSDQNHTALLSGNGPWQGAGQDLQLVWALMSHKPVE